ncbi:MAG: hypothetical protein JKY59_07085 [Emcibacter sp.]|nr:hypothetical protein [Emcibacter sp.]
MPAYYANATVIKSTDTLKNNYELHHRVIIYNNLSSYQNPKNKQKLISRDTSDYDLFNESNDGTQKQPDIDSNKLTRFPIKNPVQKTQSDLILDNEQNDDNENISVGSALDSFKEDPLLQTIYFTSKDLIFGYKKRIANIMQLGFDMETENYKKQRDLWGNRIEKIEQPLTDKEKAILKREGKILFGLIAESYKNIIYVILTMLAALLLSFRYILNRYI